jgi:hypothetical protein
MSVRNALVLLLTLSTLALLVGCGSSSPQATPPPTGGFSNSNLNGTYVISSTGIDTNGLFIAIAGTIVANGSGGITGGTVDVVGPDFTPASPVAQPITGGSYNVTVDGRGQAKFGGITLDFVLTSSSHGLVTEYDGNGTGSGTIDLQSAVTQAQLQGSYAFSIAGLDSGEGPTASAGSFTLDNVGDLTVGVQDFDDDGFPYPGLAMLPATATLGTGTGPGSITLATEALGSLTFDFYPIDATHIKLIETDYTQFYAGDAFTQTGASIPVGPMVFTLAGLDSSGSVAVGGLMTSDGTGNFSNGLEDVNDNGNLSPAQLIFSGTSFPGGSVGGRVGVNMSGFDPAIQYAIYPITGGILMIEIDGAGAITTGTAYAQTSQAIQSAQGYGLNLSAFNTAGGFEEDDIAEFTTTSAGFNGIVDINDTGTLTFDKSLTGTYTPDSPATGRGAAPTNYFTFEYYTVTDSTILILESDTDQIGVGTIELQNADPTPGAVHPIASVVHPPSHGRSAFHKRK